MGNFRVGQGLHGMHGHVYVTFDTVIVVKVVPMLQCLVSWLKPVTHQLKRCCKSTAACKYCWS